MVLSVICEECQQLGQQPLAQKLSRCGPAGPLQAWQKERADSSVSQDLFWSTMGLAIHFSYLYKVGEGG